MKNKLILSLGSSLLVFAPVMTVVACGDDKPAISEEQKQANADRDQLTSFNKTSDVSIATLDANVTTNATTFVSFTQAKATALGFGTLPALTNSSTITYSLVKNTTRAKATYSFVLKATKGASSATTAAKILTSSDDTSAPVVATIDISNKTPEQFMDAINAEINVYMPMIASELIKAANIEAFKSYSAGIQANGIIEIVNGEHKYNLDFRPMATQAARINDILVNNLKNPANVGKGANIGMRVLTYKMPRMAALTNTMMGTNWATSIGDYMTLSEMAYDPSTMTPVNGVETEAWKEFYNDHAYVQMLLAYHEALWDMMQSQAFKTWNVDKTYTFPMHISGSTAATAKWVNVNAKSGTAYDDPNTTIGGVELTNGKEQISNFEAMWVAKVLKFSEAVDATANADWKNVKTIAGKENVKATHSDFTDENFAANGNLIATGQTNSLPQDWYYQAAPVTGPIFNTDKTIDYFAYVSSSGKIQGVAYKTRFPVFTHTTQNTTSVKTMFSDLNNSTFGATGISALPSTWVEVVDYTTATVPSNAVGVYYANKMYYTTDAATIATYSVARKFSKVNSTNVKTATEIYALPLSGTVDAAAISAWGITNINFAEIDGTTTTFERTANTAPNPVSGLISTTITITSTKDTIVSKQTFALSSSTKAKAVLENERLNTEVSFTPKSDSEYKSLISDVWTTFDANAATSLGINNAIIATLLPEYTYEYKFKFSSVDTTSTDQAKIGKSVYSIVFQVTNKTVAVDKSSKGNGATYSTDLNPAYVEVQRIKALTPTSMTTAQYAALEKGYGSMGAMTAQTWTDLGFTDPTPLDAYDYTYALVKGEVVNGKNTYVLRIKATNKTISDENVYSELTLTSSDNAA